MLVVISKKRGASMLDAVVTIFFVGLIVLMFSAIFPAATSCSRQAQEYKTAVALAQRKMEQVRSLKYELLTPTVLHVNGAIDSSAGGSPYAFTTADSLTSKLTQGAGTLAIQDESSTLKRVTVTVSWISSSRSVARSVRLVTYVADRRTRRAT